VSAVSFFSRIGGQKRTYLAALDPVSGLATAWDPSMDDRVLALAVNDGTVYAAGWFRNTHFLSGAGPYVSRNFVAALDAASGLATAWDPNASSAVRSLAVVDGSIYMGGDFTGVGGSTRNHIGAVDAATGIATEWNPGANAAVRALTSGAGALYAGGDFTSLGPYPRLSLAGVLPLETVGVPEAPVVELAPLRLSPNPTSSTARIDYVLRRAGHVRIGVYDTQGRRIALPVDEARPAGRGSATWNARGEGARPGLYFIRVEAPGMRVAKRLVLVE
jgi:hypothetical protein